MIKARAFFLLSTCFAIAVFAAPALAAGDGDGEGKLMELVWQGVNLLLLVGVLVYVARKPVTQFFADRRDEIKSDIKQADELLSTSRKEFADWQGKLTDLQREVEQIREDTRRRAEEEREAIIAAAHDAAERIKEDAVAAVDQELRRAHAELREEAATLAVDLAQNMLTEQVDGRDRERLMDEFITSVEPNAAGAGASREGN